MTIDITTGVFSRLGKQPVVLQKESLGFIGNRMQFALLREALSIVQEGIATAEDVDTVVKTSFGRRLAVAGPLEVFDIAGWDTISAIIDQLFPDLETGSETPELVSDMIGRGHLGIKSGQGFYEWDADSENRDTYTVTFLPSKRSSADFRRRSPNRCPCGSDEFDSKGNCLGCSGDVLGVC